MNKLILCSEARLPEVSWTFADSPERRAELSELAENQWIARGTCGYVVFRHTDCANILRDSRWHNSASLATTLMGENRQSITSRPDSLLSAEGDVHQRLKRLVSFAFSPKSSDNLRPFMSRVLNESIDGFIGCRQTDLVANLINFFPIQVIAELLGTPKNDWQLFSKWAEDILLIFRDDAINLVGQILDSQIQLQKYVENLIADRRESPKTDLVTALIDARDKSNQLDEAEMTMMIQSIIVGGTDTTRNQIGSCVALILAHQDQWKLLVDNPELVYSATEECLRFAGTTRTTSRFASEDIEYNGLLFTRGTLVSIALATANRDTSAFPDPDSFDITRVQDRQHMTFGAGAHYCVGSSLARAEIQETLAVLAERLPNLHISGEVTWKDPLVAVMGPVSLPVAF